MVTDCKTAGPTFNVPEPDTAPTDAVMVELPTVTPVAKPELLMVAMLPDDEVQIARLLTSCVELSVNVAVAVNCWVAPAGIVALAGVTAMELITAGLTLLDAEPVNDRESTQLLTETKKFP